MKARPKFDYEQKSVIVEVLDDDGAVLTTQGFPLKDEYGNLISFAELEEDMKIAIDEYKLQQADEVARATEKAELEKEAATLAKTYEGKSYDEKNL